MRLCKHNSCIITRITEINVRSFINMNYIFIIRDLNLVTWSANYLWINIFMVAPRGVKKKFFLTLSSLKKKLKKFFLCDLMVNLNKFSLLVGHNYWKKSKNQTKKMEAHHSKDHRRIDFEPLVTEEEVRLVKARKFH